MTDSEISRTVALAWGLAAAPQRGPKRELSLERIVEAAVAIADAEGLAAVTMARVAQTFEFTTMALYRYVATKDELYRLMLDAAIVSHDTALEADDWREGLRGFLIELLDAYRVHPWMLETPLSPEIHLMPGQLQVADRGLRAMRTLPAPDEAKLAVLMLLSAFARGHASVEREVLHGDPVPPETRALLVEAATAARFPDAVAFVRSGVYFGDPEPGDPESAITEFREFAAGALLAGLEAFFGAADGGTPPPTVELSAQEAFEVAEAELHAATLLRKAAQQRVRDAERAENAARKVRDRAKELAKADQKQRARDTV
ncbi:TetR/AcrR family transcriptional regulator [Microbacterium gorillae]|uniref:TetR/AcrR family transcriptional regulator n=1 Tax=Microbacterium gorillae TaxID=1231063 RepID=UPI003D982F9D